MLSALRRTCRSETVGPPIIDCELEIGPGWPELPIIEAMASASEAAASNALYISELRTGWFSLMRLSGEDALQPEEVP